MARLTSIFPGTVARNLCPAFFNLSSWCMLAWAPMLPCAGTLAQTSPLPPITSVPPSVPYTWNNVVIRGGGFVSGLVFSPSQKGLVYARTDVGGAYRSDDAGEHWIPLTDQFGREDASYLGIESLASDPSDARKLYMAAGMYSADWGGPSAIFRSNDKGRTFEMTRMSFKMGGNDDGRGVGERLAVDPSLGSILFFGSRKAGLWKSTDSGVAWSHVDSFPVQAKVSGPGENTGITFVQFASDGAKGSPTPTLYVGVAQAGGSLYRSRDGGATWELLPGLPKNLFPSHAALGSPGTVYFTFVDNIGPNGIQDGALLKFTPGDGKWKDISPVKPGVGSPSTFGFGGVAVDAQHPETVMVTTIDRWNPGDAIFRSTDGGKKWKDVGASAQYSATSTPWVYWHRGKTGGTGWMSDIGIDPFNSGKVMYTTGEGIWGSADVTAVDDGKPTHWGFPNEGLEETVPLELVSPPQGAHLLSVVGDISGFRHDDVAHSPTAGFFSETLTYTSTGIDFAALSPMQVARVGSGNGKTVRGGYSLDNGITWKPFAAEPPGSHRGAGKVALSADGKTVVWSPEKGAPFWSADWGKTWTACAGLTDKTRVVSDRVNPAKFYSFNPETGQFLESQDKAQAFTVKSQLLPPASGGGYAHIAVMPGMEGDLWVAAGQKLFHSSDSGGSFVPLDGMNKVSTLGFGMAAPGSDLPTIYVNGTAAGKEGTFRSDDGGQDWIRIDDPTHQFGWKNSITGDPRVFGRIYLATGGRGIICGDPAQPLRHPPASGTE